MEVSKMTALDIVKDGLMKIEECARFNIETFATGIRSFVLTYEIDKRDQMVFDMTQMECLGDIEEIFVENALAFEITLYKTLC